jgi:hypothetical protein
MSEEQLGFDPTIAEDGGRYTTIQRDGQIERTCLEDRIKRQRLVAGRATTCRKGSVADFAIFSLSTARSRLSPRKKLGILAG